MLEDFREERIASNFFILQWDSILNCLTPKRGRPAQFYQNARECHWLVVVKDLSWIRAWGNHNVSCFFLCSDEKMLEKYLLLLLLPENLHVPILSLKHILECFSSYSLLSPQSQSELHHCPLLANHITTLSPANHSFARGSIKWTVSLCLTGSYYFYVQMPPSLQSGGNSNQMMLISENQVQFKVYTSEISESPSGVLKCHSMND